jgi:hypothetical protein
MIVHNFAGSRQRADRMIRKWGVPGVLRRASGDRPCWVVIQDYSPIERVGKMIDPVDRLALVSAIERGSTNKLLLAPDREQDRLVTFVPGSDPLVEDETLRMSAPPGKLAPGNVIVYWELRVRA